MTIPKITENSSERATRLKSRGDGSWEIFKERQRKVYLDHQLSNPEREEILRNEFGLREDEQGEVNRSDSTLPDDEREVEEPAEQSPAFLNGDEVRVEVGEEEWEFSEGELEGAPELGDMHPEQFLTASLWVFHNIHLAQEKWGRPIPSGGLGMMRWAQADKKTFFSRFVAKFVERPPGEKGSEGIVEDDGRKLTGIARQLEVAFELRRHGLLAGEEVGREGAA